MGGRVGIYQLSSPQHTYPHKDQRDVAIVSTYVCWDPAIFSTSTDTRKYQLAC